MCTVCSVTYDYILHFEALDVEEEEMLEQLGLRQATLATKWESETWTGFDASFQAKMEPEIWKNFDANF